MLIDPTWQSRALEAHLMYPTGDVMRLPASRSDDDAGVSLGADRAKRANDRYADHARRLGMSQAEYRRQRAAGTLPAWCYVRAPYTRRT